MGEVGPERSVAPEIRVGSRRTVTEFAGELETFVTPTKRENGSPARTVAGAVNVRLNVGLRTRIPP